MLTAEDGPLLVIFSAVVRCGSFTAAATTLKLSKSTISERVKQLEERCGAKLLERTTRSLRLTSPGASVLEAAVQLQDALLQLSQQLDDDRAEPTGVFRISTTNDLGPLFVAPVVARFVTIYQKVRVEVLAEDARRDMIEASIDIAIRLGAPQSATQVAHKLALLQEPIVAAPSLAEQLGEVSHPRELTKAPWVRHSLLSSSSMRFTGPQGACEEIIPNTRAESNAGATLLSLLLHGAGVGVLPEHALREHLHSGRLVRLCPGWIWKSVHLYASTPSRRHQRPGVKAFLKMLREQIALDNKRWL